MTNLIVYLNNLKMQLFEKFIDYQKYFNLMKAFHFYLKMTIIRRINAIVFRNELREIARLIEKIEFVSKHIKKIKKKWSIISKRIVFNFMNAIASTLLTHHRKRFKAIIETKIVIEKNFENEIEIKIEKILIFINHSKDHRIAVKSNFETAKWEIVTYVTARNFSKTIKKKKRLVDVIFVVQIRIDWKEIIKHMFITIILYLNIEQKTIRIMINCDATFNFIFQMKIKKWNLQEFVNVSFELKTLNDIFFKCYKTHVLRIEMIDSSKREIRIKQTIIVADMIKIDMILNFLWLKKLNSDIDWFFVIMRWRIENAKKFQKRTHVMIVAIDTYIANSSTRNDAQNKSSIENNTNLQDSNITIINQLIFEMYCKKKNVQIYIFDCKNLHDIEYTMHELIIEAMMKSLQKIFEKYKDFANVFDKMKINELSKHDSQNHEINTKNKMSSFESIYNLFVIEFEVFKEYFDEFLIKEFIVSSFSSTKILILFIKKSKNDLKLCVDYKKLNAITIKNRYSIFLMNQLLNRFSDVKRFTKLNIQTAYNFIRIKKKDEWKTTFRCRYEQFEYRIMFFDFANAFATFQIYRNFALKEYLNDFCVCYLNDILIYFQKEENHTNHVRLVLKRLKKHKMFGEI
jgi:hypothetical protein